MNMLTIGKDEMKGLVAKSLPVKEETMLDIKSDSIKVFLVSGYCNGEKVTETYLARKGDKVNPKLRSFKTLLLKDSEKILMLELIDTDAVSVFNHLVASSELGKKHIIKDSDNYYKALQVEIMFNYGIDESYEALSKFLRLVGESSLEVKFLDKNDSNKLVTLKGQIISMAESAVERAIRNSRSLSEVEEKVEKELEDELKQPLGQYGIKFSGVKAIPTVMREDLLGPDMIARNNEVRAEASKKEITTSADIDQHKQKLDNETTRQGVVQKNEIKLEEGQGVMIDANTSAKKKKLEAQTEKDIFEGMSPQQHLLYLVDNHPDLIIGMIKAATDSRTGSVLSGRAETLNIISQFLNAMIGSGRQAYQTQIEATETSGEESLSKNHEISSEKKGGAVYDE